MTPTKPNVTELRRYCTGIIKTAEDAAKSRRGSDEEWRGQRWPEGAEEVARALLSRLPAGNTGMDRVVVAPEDGNWPTDWVYALLNHTREIPRENGKFRIWTPRDQANALLTALHKAGALAVTTPPGMDSKLGHGSDARHCASAFYTDPPAQGHDKPDPFTARAIQAAKTMPESLSLDQIEVMQEFICNLPTPTVMGDRNGVIEAAEGICQREIEHWTGRNYDREQTATNILREIRTLKTPSRESGEVMVGAPGGALPSDSVGRCLASGQPWPAGLGEMGKET